MTIPPEQFAEAYRKLPRPIREFIAEGGLTAVVQELGQTHSLHVDSTGVLADLMTETLIGLVNPKDLPGELSHRLNLPPESVPPFINDLNDKIFMPLQKRVREQSEEEAKEDADRFEPEPVAKPEPMPVMQVGAPQPTAWPQPASSAPIYSAPAPPAPYIRTMATDIELASHGLQGQAVTPARSFQTASVPITQTQAPAAAPLPPPQSVPPPEPAPAPEYPMPPLASVRLTPVDHPSQNTPLTKEYGSDPYREPID